MQQAKIIEAYPLQWPAGWKRTTSVWQRQAKFHATFSSARDGLLREIRLMGGVGAVLSTNVPLRKDGLPCSGMAQPDDTGVAVYFQRKGKPMVLACDRWKKVEDNMRALELTAEAMRGLDRWGSSELLERTFTGFAALPPPPAQAGWKSVLGIPELTTPTVAMVRDRRNELVKQYHPDRGGDASRMAEINRAYDQALSELS
jgi:hypothetical protein